MSRAKTTNIIGGPKINVDQLRKTREMLRRIRKQKPTQENRYDILGRSSRPLVPADDDSSGPVRKKARE